MYLSLARIPFRVLGSSVYVLVTSVYIDYLSEADLQHTVGASYLRVTIVVQLPHVLSIILETYTSKSSAEVDVFFSNREKDLLRSPSMSNIT